MATRIKGKEQIQAAIDKATARYRKAVEAAVYQEGLDLIATSVRMVPVDTGRLRASHYVAPPERGLVEVGYGADYAVPVHERTEVRHVTGEAKFLEKAVDRHRRGYTSRIAERSRDNYASGITPAKVRRSAPEQPHVTGRSMGKARRLAKEGK